MKYQLSFCSNWNILLKSEVLYVYTETKTDTTNFVQC